MHPLIEYMKIHLISLEQDSERIEAVMNQYTNFEDDAVMGDDLHMNNVGLWKGNLVAIDFGYHCVCQ